jgi:hypothetical protein
MTYLFNSKGNHVANLVGEQLHAPTGKNIGHYKPDVGILIDMSGRYLGEIIHGDRLMYNLSSPYKSTNYGNHGNHGSVGNYGNPGNHGSIGVTGGYRDVSTDWL